MKGIKVELSEETRTYCQNCSTEDVVCEGCGGELESNEDCICYGDGTHCCLDCAKLKKLRGKEQ